MASKTVRPLSSPAPSGGAAFGKLLAGTLAGGGLLAALLGVVLARREARSADATCPHGVRSEWSSRSRLLRAPLQRGPGGWRASARPR